MKTIYLMRHGRTLFNVMGLNQGMSDSPLTKEGIEEALKTKEWFIDNKVAFDSVYASTLKRACDTTELVTDMPYQRYKGLEEIFIGTKEASPFKDNPPYPYGDFYVKYGGEDLDEFTDRVYKAVYDIAKNDKGNTILIVSHGMAIRRFLEVINCTREVKDGFLGNCGFVKMSFDGENFEVLDIVNPNKLSIA